MKLFEKLGFGTPREKATPKEAVVERLFTKEQMEAWEKIQGDKQLRGILAEFTRGHLREREHLVLHDVKDFLGKYPTLDFFRSSAAKREEILNDIGMLNGPEKRNQYEQKFAEFERIMYGKSEKEE